MKKQTLRAWLYLLPAILFLGFFLVYPLIDVFVYSMEEGYNFASQTYFGTGFYNYSYVLHDPYFLQAVKNTFLLVVITVPLSTGFALLISLALSSIKALRDLYQTVFFLPYVTNTLAVGIDVYKRQPSGGDGFRTVSEKRRTGEKDCRCDGCGRTRAFEPVGRIPDDSASSITGGKERSRP